LQGIIFFCRNLPIIQILVVGELYSSSGTFLGYRFQLQGLIFFSRNLPRIQILVVGELYSSSGPFLGYRYWL